MAHESDSSPHGRTRTRQALIYVILTLVVSWLLWVPASEWLTGGSVLSGGLFQGIGSVVPLGVVVFLNVLYHESSFRPLAWLKTLGLSGLVVAITLPLLVLLPALLWQLWEGSFELNTFITAFGLLLPALPGLLVLGFAEEIGWRGYLLVRLRAWPLVAVNLVIGVLWFLWQLPILNLTSAGTFEAEGLSLAGSLLFAILITPFFNRLALRADNNVLLPALLRAALGFFLAFYLGTRPLDSLTSPFGWITLSWLAFLNLLLFAQLWRGHRPPDQVSELDRVMPLGAI